MIRRTFKFRLYPTPEQEVRLTSWCAAIRRVYNSALEQRSTYSVPKNDDDTKQEYADKLRSDYHGRDRRFTAYGQGREIKLREWAKDPDLEWIADAPAEAYQYALGDLDKAYANFFAGRADPPSWRNAVENKSFTVAAWKVSPKRSRKFRLNVSLGRNCITLPKIGRISYVKHRSPKRGTKLKTATVINDGGRWFVCLSAEIETADAPTIPRPAVGIDLGVAQPVTLSTGEVMGKRTEPKITARMKKLSRDLARAKKGSNRRKAAKERLGKVKRLIADRRKAQCHRITTDIARRYSLIAVEDLKVKNMTGSAKGTVEAPGKNVRAKAGLNREMLDVAPFMLRSQLEYKSAAYGGEVVAVNPAYTSQTCPSCGSVDAGNRPSQSEFKCLSCGFSGNADVIAATNILARGLDGGRCGSSIRVRSIPDYREGARKGDDLCPSRPAFTAQSIGDPAIIPAACGLSVDGTADLSGNRNYSPSPASDRAVDGTADLSGNRNVEVCHLAGLSVDGTADLSGNRNLSRAEAKAMGVDGTADLSGNRNFTRKRPCPMSVDGTAELNN